MILNGKEFDFNSFFIRMRLMHRFNELEKITDKWGFIRQIYMEKLPTIMSRERIDPYFLDWSKHFSPAESRVWSDIRTIGVPFYPQFPVFNYFIDFANPRLRIGLEVDGAEWHDVEKDKQRDQFLLDFGWKIFRVSGSEAMRTINPFDDECDYDDWPTEKMRRWMMMTSEGVVSAIKDVYFSNTPDRHDWLPVKSLQAHKLADFEVCAKATEMCGEFI